MNNTSALGAVRSRWWVVALLTAVGAALGALPEPSRVSEQSQATQYQATHTLLINNTDFAYSSSTGVSPNQITLLATNGEVPKRVAEEVRFGGNGAELASQVQVAFDPSTGALTFTTTQSTTQQAETVANTFALVTNSYIAERQDLVYQDRLTASLARVEELEAEMADVTKDLGLSPADAILLAQQDSLSRQLSVAFEQESLLTDSPTVLSFTTLAEAEAVAIENKGLAAPQSRETRGLLGAVVGAMVGLGVAILLSRVDRKIRTREQAEAVTGLRARVLIPKVRDPKHAQAIVKSGKHDALFDSYRTLRNVVGFMQGSLPPVDRARVTLVVSPGPGEGKTSLAGNLAATFAETGQRTIAVNTDFRRPQLTARLTDDPDEPLPFMLEDLEWLPADRLLRTTIVPNLTLLDLATLGSADELARATAGVLPRLIDDADAVVIDTSPVTATAEVLELVPLADLIVVVLKLGKTDMESAERTIAILKDLTNVPLLMVLTGLKQERTYYYDYSDRRSAAHPDMPKMAGRVKGWGKRARRARQAERPRLPVRRKPQPLGDSDELGRLSTLDIESIDELLRRDPARPESVE